MYVCMYVCLSISASEKTARGGENAGGEPDQFCFMPWLPWRGWLCMALTSAWCSCTRSTLWATLCARWWSNDSTSRCGSTSRTECRWRSGGGATCGGTVHPHFRLFMKAGFCCSGILISWRFYGPSAGLIRNFAAPCSVFCAYAKTRNWIHWTRTLQGAYKHCKGSFSSDASHLAQASTYCMLLLLGLTLLWGGLVACVGLLLLQVRRHQHGSCEPLVPECPYPVSFIRALTVIYEVSLQVARKLTCTCYWQRAQNLTGTLRRTPRRRTMAARRRGGGEENTWGDLSDSEMEEVFVDDAVSDGPDWQPTEAEPVPRWGPPPPSPVHIDQGLSQRISTAVHQTFMELGLPKSLFLTQVYPDVRACDKITILVKPMTPAEAMHPQALWTGSDEEPGTPPAPPSSTPRRRRQASTTASTSSAPPSAPPTSMTPTGVATGSGEPRGTAMLTTAPVAGTNTRRRGDTGDGISSWIESQGQIQQARGLLSSLVYALPHEVHNMYGPCTRNLKSQPRRTRTG